MNLTNGKRRFKSLVETFETIPMLVFGLVLMYGIGVVTLPLTKKTGILWRLPMVPLVAGYYFLYTWQPLYMVLLWLVSTVSIFGVTVYGVLYLHEPVADALPTVTESEIHE